MLHQENRGAFKYLNSMANYFFYDNKYRKVLIDADNHTPLLDLHVGDFVYIAHRPCRLNSVVENGIGYSGYPELKITGTDIETGKILNQFDYEGLPLVNVELERNSYLLVDIDEDNYLILMRQKGELKEDVKLCYGSSDEDSQKADHLKRSFEAGHQIQVTLMKWINFEKFESFSIIDDQ